MWSESAACQSCSSCKCIVRRMKKRLAVVERGKCARQGGGGDRMTDDAVEEMLDKVVKLLAYISDKDLFAEFYRKRLSRRLLAERSASDDHERAVLTRLKQQCGAQFTSKVRGPSPAVLAPHHAMGFADNAHIGGSCCMLCEQVSAGEDGGSWKELTCSHVSFFVQMHAVLS